MKVSYTKVGFHEDDRAQRLFDICEETTGQVNIPGIYHGYKALEPNSIMMYYLDEKYDLDHPDEEKVLPGHFGENWGTESK